MNKRLVCAAVGSALAAGLSAPAAFAYHDRNILVPYVVKDSNRTTVVTLIGESYPSKTDVHLQYWTKSTTAANTAACQPSSVFVPFTPNDIMTFDTAGILGYPLFGDTTNPAALGASISYAAPRHGYLAIQFDDGSGRAYWMELDLSNGGAHGDYALNGNSGPDGAGSFVHISESQTLWPFGPGDGFDEQAPVPFWPSSVANTAFTVTPLGTAMLTKENNQVVLQVVNSNGVQGAYDRNENGVDGTVPVTVRCVGRLTLPQLMPGVVSNAAWAAQGGWGFLANLGDGDGNYGEWSISSGSVAIGGDDQPAVVYQVDTSSAGGRFMSNATRIVQQPEEYYRGR